MPDRENTSVVFLHTPDNSDALKILYHELAQSGIVIGDTDINPMELAGEFSKRLA